MLDQSAGHRPAIATFFGLVSVFWSIIVLGWVLVVVGFALLIGLGGWLGGPVLGFVGTALGIIIALYCVLSSLMSFLLLWAGWLVLRGNPSGVPLLRLWAWLSLIFDTVTLLASGGTAPISWGSFLYAVAILYFTRPLILDQRWVSADTGSNPYKPKPSARPDHEF